MHSKHIEGLKFMTRVSPGYSFPRIATFHPFSGFFLSVPDTRGTKKNSNCWPMILPLHDHHLVFLQMPTAQTQTSVLDLDGEKTS